VCYVWVCVCVYLSVLRVLVWVCVGVGVFMCVLRVGVCVWVGGCVGGGVCRWVGVFCVCVCV